MTIEAPITDQTGLGDEAAPSVAYESTIRERIILNVEAKLREMRSSKGYRTECGDRVFRAKYQLDPDDLPVCVIWPQTETVTREYGNDIHEMPLRVEGLMALGGSNASDLSERIMGDLIEAMTGRKWTMAFSSGGTYQITPGDTLLGETSGATARVEAVALTGGSWAAGTASGTFTLRRKRGSFQSENLTVGDHADVATTPGVATVQSPVTTATGDLAGSIEYTEGGTDAYPKPGEVSVGSSALFAIKYRTVSGNPYEQ